MPDAGEPDAGEPLSPQAADLVRRIARTILDDPDDLMDQVHAAVSAAADEPLRSDPTLAAEVAASTRSKVLHWAASWCRIAQVSPTWDRNLL